MTLPKKNGWYVVKKLHGSTDAARLAEMGVVPGAGLWLGVQGMPAGVVYLRTHDGALIVRRQELSGVEFLQSDSPSGKS